MTKKKFVVYLFSIVAVAAVLIMLQKNIKQGRVCFKEYCFSVELAKSRLARTKGLMFRREMPPDHGMLFVYQDEEPRSFWMKNTFLPLDIIFLNKNKEVVSIKKNLQPCEADFCSSIKPEEKAQYVLELNANIADKINLKPGDKLDFDVSDF